MNTVFIAQCENVCIFVLLLAFLFITKFAYLIAGFILENVQAEPNMEVEQCAVWQVGWNDISCNAAYRSMCKIGK